MVATRPPFGAAGLNCPSCGAAIALSTGGWSVTVACATCGAVLDAQDPNLRILQRQERAITVKPRIPLGSRGRWKDMPWEVVGFQQVTITVDGEDYSWTEYVCFNPYRGFLYLSEYEGHWNVIEKLRTRPSVDPEGARTIEFAGRVYKHFQTATARTTFALGEFPWEVNVGDTVRTHDFVAPPYMLSAESTEHETTWSLGTYTAPEALARAFAVQDPLRTPAGVFANQPNPHVGASKSLRRVASLFMLALVAMFAINVAIARRETVFNGTYRYDPARGDSAAFVTDPFDLKGRTSNVEFRITSDVENNWLWFNFALINEATGQATDVGRQVSYYHGSDSDGSWSEGSRNDSFRLGSVPSGRYILRVAPEGGEPGVPAVAYTLAVRRDVPSFGFYFVAFFALLVPALLSVLPAASFEQRRWAESDQGGATSAASSDDDDDDSSDHDSDDDD